jgi:hypothetical protein
MKIGIISDTHDVHRNALKAAEIFAARKVNYIFHAGDIVSGYIAEILAGVEGAKFIGVFGNCDTERAELTSATGIYEGQIHDVFSGEIGGRRIFIKHKVESPEEIAADGKYDLVIYGHTHRKDIHRIGGTLIVNPGTARHWLMGKSEVVVVELDDMSTEEISLR